jgi:hypothetical protein
MSYFNDYLDLLGLKPKILTNHLCLIKDKDFKNMIDVIT